MLYLVATPIGNLQDISLRGLQVLQDVDIVACEDTRHARILFEKHGIRPRRLVSYHAHNERSRASELAEDLRTGASVAVVTDAGTPGISDPAWAIVKEALSLNIDIIPVPGACAAIAGLSASGMDTTRFVFEGFLPLKKGRQTRLRQLAQEERTVVMYESPHRIKRLLRELAEVCGASREVAVARELTKIHEQFHRGSLEQVAAQLEEKFPESVKGECVVILAGLDTKRKTDDLSQDEGSQDEG